MKRLVSGILAVFFLTTVAVSMTAQTTTTTTTVAMMKTTTTSIEKGRNVPDSRAARATTTTTTTTIAPMMYATTTTTVAGKMATTTTVAATPYNEEATKQTMHQFLDLLGKLKPALAANDFYTAADQFYAMGKLGQKLALTKAPKGSDAEWAKTWETFIAAAFKGVGASGEKDAAKAQKALDELLATNKKGHGMFKS